MIVRRVAEQIAGPALLMLLSGESAGCILGTVALETLRSQADPRGE